MVMRRCPKCGTTSDDVYGFCIKCGYEYPKQNLSTNNQCPICKFNNSEEAEICANCGAILKINGKKIDIKKIRPIIVENNNSIPNPQKNYNWLIALGYLFSIIPIMDGIFGLIIGIYLTTRQDKKVKRHGHAQIAIVAAWLIIFAILVYTGIYDQILNQSIQILKAQGMNTTYFENARL